MANLNKPNKASAPYGNMQQPMFGGTQQPMFNGIGVNGQGISGRFPVGGNRSSDVPMGPPSDLQNPPSEFMPGPIHPPMLLPDRPNPKPNFDPFPPDTWGRPDREEGDPVNPQKQDGDGNWYEWDGHQWKPIMGPKPDIYPKPNLVRPMLQGLKNVRPIWTVPFMFGS